MSPYDLGPFFCLWEVSSLLLWESSEIAGGMQFSVYILAVREITESSSTFSATNISSNMIWFRQLHDTIKWNQIVQESTVVLII